LGKLRVLSGEQVSAILEQQGFVAVRQKGSHRILQKRTPNGTVSVPVPLHNPIRRGTLLSIIRQSGVLKALFEVGE
jgi:predicted RNA binding protein YcfA (HicA-like mRNA interferase family)